MVACVADLTDEAEVQERSLFDMVNDTGWGKDLQL